MESKTIPADFKKVTFEGSWDDPEIVKVAETIVIIQKKMNLEKWVPFSVSNYMDLCNHIMEGKERVILERMVVTGFLKIHNEKMYVVTPLFLEMIEKFSGKK